MARSYDELRNKMSVEQRQRVEARVEVLLKETRLREAINNAQREFAEGLRASQAAISKLEQQPDMLLKTLSKYVEGLGAELVVAARFPEGDVEITLERND